MRPIVMKEGSAFYFIHSWPGFVESAFSALLQNKKAPTIRIVLQELKEPYFLIPSTGGTEWSLYPF